MSLTQVFLSGILELGSNNNSGQYHMWDCVPGSEPADRYKHQIDLTALKTYNMKRTFIAFRE